MRKFWLSALLCMGLLLGLACGASAAETTLYVRTGGTGDGTSAASPLGSLAAAAEVLGGGDGKIVILGNLVLGEDVTLPEAGSVTYTAEGGSLILYGDLSFAKNTDSGVITLDLPVAARGRRAILGGFNTLVFGEHFSVDGALDFFGGVDTMQGVMRQDATNRAKGQRISCELPYSVTVNAGTFATFAGGNRRADRQNLVGSITAPLTVTVNGGTFGGKVGYDTASNNKDENAFSLSGMSLLCDDATLTINGGSFNLPIYAQGRLGEVGHLASYNSIYASSDRSRYALDGDIAVNITGGSFAGGEISAFQTSTGYTQVLRGNFDVTVGAGATFAAGTVVDATQVKAYPGTDKKATLTCPAASGLTIKRFDVVNGEAQTYTEPLRISFVGDSITEGTGAADPTHNAYTARILERAEQEGMELVVSNFGVGASTVLPYNQIRHRDTLAGVLSLTEADSAYVLVALGTNDALIAGGTVGQRAHFEREYEALLRDYAALPDTTRVFTTSAIYRYTSNKEADIRAVSVIRPIQARVTRALAAEVPGKFTYIDLYALLLPDAVSDALFAGDKLHPDADGYKLYAAAVYNAIFGGVTEVENFYRTDIYVSAAGRLAGAGTAADPISSLPVAFGLADPDGDATIHIMGTVTYTKFVTPLGSGTLTFVGEGTDATLALTGDMIRLGAGARFDNLTLRRNTGIAYLALGWNNAEFTETVKTAGNFYMLCGNLLFEGNFSKTAADDAASAGSSADQTVTVNGGRYMFLVGGNYRLFGTSPFATYSGNLTLHIGAGATVAANGMNGFAGQNYLTGSVHATVAGTLSGNFRDYTIPGKTEGQRYEAFRNTGKVTVETVDGAALTRIIAGDLNRDGKVDLADALLLCKAAADGSLDAAVQPYYHGLTEVGLADVCTALAKLAK